MADAYPRIAADSPTSPVGYRPLPGASTKSGPDLGTMVFATIGVALGIVVGTVCADASSRPLVPRSHPLVLAGAAKPTAAAEEQSAAAAPRPVDDRTEAQKDLDKHPLPQRTLPPVSNGSGMLIVSAMPHAALAPRSIAASHSVAHAQAARPLVAKAAGAPALVSAASGGASSAQAGQVTVAPSGHGSLSRQASLTRKRRAERRLAARNRRAAWRKAHPGRPVPAYLTAALARPRPPVANVPAANVPAADTPAADTPPAPKVEAAPVPERFTFTVEGFATIFNYDAQTGVIQTYEGDVFVLNQPPAQGPQTGWLDTTTDLHYTCDQDGSCSVGHGTGPLMAARRTH